MAEQGERIRKMTELRGKWAPDSCCFFFGVKISTGIRGSATLLLVMNMPGKNAGGREHVCQRLSLTGLAWGFRTHVAHSAHGGGLSRAAGVCNLGYYNRDPVKEPPASRGVLP